MTAYNGCEIDALDLHFEYALLYHAYEAHDSFEELAELSNRTYFEFQRTGVWTGSAKDLRATLFFQHRGWRHGGYGPEGEDLQALQDLYETIQRKIREGDLAPNFLPEGNYALAEAVVVDGQPARLLAWERRGRQASLTVALDRSGEVVERLSPPTAAKGAYVQLGGSSPVVQLPRIEGEALIRVIEHRVAVAPLRYEWDGQTPKECFDESRVVGWVDVAALLTRYGRDELESLVLKAHRRRRASYRKCIECGESVPPEHRMGKTCHSCMEKAGTVF